jgi:hypothetical protein
VVAADGAEAAPGVEWHQFFLAVFWFFYIECSLPAVSYAVQFLSHLTHGTPVGPRGYLVLISVNFYHEIVYQSGFEPRIMTTEYLAHPSHSVNGRELSWVRLLPSPQAPSDLLREQRLFAIQQFDNLADTFRRHARIEYLGDLLFWFCVISRLLPSY